MAPAGAPPWLPLWGAKRGLVVNECPVGIQIQTVTEPAGEKLSPKVTDEVPVVSFFAVTSSVSHTFDSFPMGEAKEVTAGG